MWEIENHADILCIDKDDNAEQFLCDAYGVVKPIVSPSTIVIQVKNSEVAAALMPEVAKIVQPEVKTVPKKETLIDNLEFSDDESEDMSSLYAKLIIIAGYEDTPTSNISLHLNKPDSSSANHEAAALINSDPSDNNCTTKDCWVLVEKMSEEYIRNQLNEAPECASSSLYKKPFAVETITIDSDDNHSLDMAPSTIVDMTQTKTLSKNKKFTKPLFEKCVDDFRGEKPLNAPPTTKKITNKSKERQEKKDAHEFIKKAKEVPLSFDNLFNKRFTILGSGLKIGKKAINVPQTAVITEERKEEIIDLVEEADETINNVPNNNKETVATKCCATQNIEQNSSEKTTQDTIEKTVNGIGYEEMNLADDDDDDDGYNGLWAGVKELVSTNDVIEIEDDDDMEVMNKGRVQESYDFNEEEEEADITVITSNEEYYEEQMVNGEEQYMEEEVGEEGEVLEWRPIELEDGRSKWFDVDKYNYRRSPPRYCDLVESKVIKPPPEDEFVMNDRFYHLWTEKNAEWTHYHSGSRSGRGGRTGRTGRGRRDMASYAHKFLSPYTERDIPQHTEEQRYARNAAHPYNGRITANKRGYQDTDKPNEGQGEKSFDVWKRLIESKKQYWQDRGNHESGGCEPMNKPPQARPRYHYPCSIDHDPSRTKRHNYPYQPFPLYLPPMIFEQSHLSSSQYYSSHYPGTHINGGPQMNHNNGVPVPYTPESPDPVMEDDDLVIDRALGGPHGAPQPSPLSPPPSTLGYTNQGYTPTTNTHTPTTNTHTHTHSLEYTESSAIGPLVGPSLQTQLIAAADTCVGV